jgi:retron-type reverse transcriptase
MGKDLTEVRSPQRKLAPDIVGSEKRKPTSLRGIANKAKADKRHRFRDLCGCLNVEFLLDCWPYLNKDAASGVDGVTWQKYAEDLHANVEALVGRLESKHYRAKLVRRQYIPKENGKERPLGIPVIEDKFSRQRVPGFCLLSTSRSFWVSVMGTVWNVGQRMRCETSPLTCNTGVMDMR